MGGESARQKSARRGEGEHDASQRKRERGSRRGAGRGGSAGASRERARDVRGTSEARTAYLGQDILDEPHLGRGVQHAHHEPEDENHEGYPSAPHRGRHRALLGGGARADGRRRRIARYRPRARPALRLPRRHRRALSTPGAPLPSEPSEKPRLGKSTRNRDDAPVRQITEREDVSSAVCTTSRGRAPTLARSPARWKKPHKVPPELARAFKETRLSHGLARRSID
jgi:hypothetical protein